MRLARGLERRLEHLVDGLASTLFGPHVHPTELATRLLREADLSSSTGKAGLTVPNVYRLRLPTREPPEPGASGRLRRELASVLEETALENGWRLEGPIEVHLEAGGGSGGVVKCDSSVMPGTIPAWGRLDEVDNGRTLEVRYIRNLIGRGPEADVSLREPEVSRRHAVLWRERDGLWLEDLSSANGTQRNGAAVTKATMIGIGDHLTFGPVTFRMTMA